MTRDLLHEFVCKLLILSFCFGFDFEDSMGSTFLKLDTTSCNRIVSVPLNDIDFDDFYHSRWIQTIVHEDTTAGTSTKDEIRIDWEFNNNRKLSQRFNFMVDTSLDIVYWTIYHNNVVVDKITGIWQPDQIFGEVYEEIYSYVTKKFKIQAINQNIPFQPNAVFWMKIQQNPCECTIIFENTTLVCDNTIMSFSIIRDDKETDDIELDYDSLRLLDDEEPDFTVRDYTINKVSIIYPNDGEQNDNFGNAVDISGNLSVIGAYSAKIDGVATGMAYIYRFNDTHWVQEGKLTSEGSQSHDFFGWSVACYHNVVIVGAYMASGDSYPVGAAYIFAPAKGNTWSRQAILKAPYRDIDDDGGSPEYIYFGWSVEVYKGTAFVGAYGDTALGSFSGSVFVFKRKRSGKNSYDVSWEQQTQLLASDGAAFDSFGWCVSAYGDYVVIGAYGDTDSADDDAYASSQSDETYAGSAYVFNLTEANNNWAGGWSQMAKLRLPDGARHDFFGWSASIWRDNAVVSAHSSSVDNYGTGAVYVWKRSNSMVWSLQAKLSPKEQDKSLYFGYCVSLYNNILAVGAYGDSYNSNSQREGTVYIYVGQTSGAYVMYGEKWYLQARLWPNRTQTKDDFGVSVAIYNDVVLVGSKLANGNSEDSGGAYAFSEAKDAKQTYFPVDNNTFVALAALVPIGFIVLFGIALCIMLVCFPPKKSLIEEIHEEVDDSAVEIASPSSHSVSSRLLISNKSSNET